MYCHWIQDNIHVQTNHINALISLNEMNIYINWQPLCTDDKYIWMKFPNILEKHLSFLIGMRVGVLFNKYFVKCLAKKYPFAPTFLHFPYMTIVNFEEKKVPVDLKSKKSLCLNKNKKHIMQENVVLFQPNISILYMACIFMLIAIFSLFYTLTVT